MSQMDSRRRISLARTGAALALLAWSATPFAQVRTQPVRTADVAVSYVAAHSLQVGTGQNFWLNGGAAEAGTSLWHGIGPAVNFTGTTTGHVGDFGAPLSLVTFAAGPRVRAREHDRVSPYGEALFGFAHGFNSLFPTSGGTVTSSANSFAFQVGGGLDIQAGARLFLRPVDVSYLRTELPNGTNGVQNTLRLGFGIGFTFGRR